MVRFDLPFFMWFILLYVQSVSFAYMCMFSSMSMQYIFTCNFIHIYTVNAKNAGIPHIF